MSAQPTPITAMQRHPLWYLGRPAAMYVDALAHRAGRYDVPSGRHLSVHDDLDEVLAGVDDVHGRDLYVLSQIMPRRRQRVLALD
jgi:hypothetical protein